MDSCCREAAAGEGLRSCVGLPTCSGPSECRRNPRQGQRPGFGAHGRSRPRHFFCPVAGGENWTAQGFFPALLPGGVQSAGGTQGSVVSKEVRVPGGAKRQAPVGRAAGALAVPGRAAGRSSWAGNGFASHHVQFRSVPLGSGTLGSLKNPCIPDFTREKSRGAGVEEAAGLCPSSEAAWYGADLALSLRASSAARVERAGLAPLVSGKHLPARGACPSTSQRTLCGRRDRCPCRHVCRQSV